ncbi:MAG: sialate O-acetylesterase, partial [Planctomycetota bacterium]
MTLILCGAAVAWERGSDFVTAAGPTPWQVFILAGQSNMEGKAKVSLLENQLEIPEFAAELGRLRPNGEWLVRNDVQIKFFDRRGPLTVGFGSPGCSGPELGFGVAVGEHFEQPVLLIKTAWGGKSLYRDFRPPSAGPPKAEIVDSLLASARRRAPETTREEIEASFGQFYRRMIDEVEQTLGNLSETFPEYDDQGWEVAGFVWFQGWNDMVNEDFTAAYADNLACLIRDVRRAFDTPKLPVVIGQLGVGGAKDVRPRTQAFKDAQAEPAAREEFQGNVRIVETDQYWDEEADAVFQSGWKEHLEEWNRIGSDYPFHYLGSVRTLYQIGEALGQAMIQLIDAEQNAFYDPIEREVEGWTVSVDPQLLGAPHRKTGDAALAALANHLQRVKFIVPADRVEELQRFRIWIDLDHPEINGMQYHPSREWLESHGHDLRLAKHVHIPQAAELVARRNWAKHPYVVLHELAHAYHDQTLGFDHQEIRKAFEAVQQQGIYDNVLLFTGDKGPHYALTDHKE